MNSKKSLLAIFLVLFLSGCSSLEAFFESSSVAIISPVEGLRLTDVPQAGQAAYTPIVLLLLSNHEGAKVARVWVNDVGPAYCLLTPDIKQDCGLLPLINQGPQTVRVEIDIMDGNKVYATQPYSVSFLWAPYSRLDKGIAWITGNSGGDPSGGYLLVGFIAACLASVTLSIKGGKWGAIVGFFLPLIGLAYVSYQTGSAVISLAILQGVFGTLGAGLVVVVILAWLNSDKAISGPQWVSTKGFDSRGLPYERQVMNAGFIGPAAQSPQTAQIARALIGAGEEPLTPIEMQALLESGLGSQLQIEASDIPLQVPKKKTSLFRFH